MAAQGQDHLGSHDFENARRLLKLRYEEEDLPQPVAYQQGPGPQPPAWEQARYDAEVEFFGCGENREEVEQLLDRIVDQRYRRSERPYEIIDLRGIPARWVIAAERLFQRKLILLSGGQGNIDAQAEVNVGLQEGDWQFDNGPRYGLAEYYQVRGGNEVVKISHIARVAPSLRMGRKFTHFVPGYLTVGDRPGINAKLAEQDPKVLVKAFKEMCAGMRVSDFGDRELLQILFHVLVNEQSQFQSSCYIGGPDFKFGMIVSFARLVKMLDDGHISTRDVFEEYKLYSTVNVLGNERTIRQTCANIDSVYMQMYNLNELTKQHATADLEFLYG